MTHGKTFVSGLRPAALALVVLSLLLLPAAAPAQEAVNEDSLQAVYDAAVSGGDDALAIAAAKDLYWVQGERFWNVLYDLAALHAKRGRRAEMYEYLYSLADAGYWDARRLRDDDAFAAFREEPLFGKLVRKTWANGYLAMLERDEREDFQHKDEILSSLGLEAGMTVADIGAGSGYFALPMAGMVGETGTILAIDASQEMLDYIARRLEIEEIGNIELRKVGRDDPELPAGGVDLILMVDTIHYIKERTAYAEKLRDGLAPGGRLVIIDYRPKPWNERPWGPPEVQQIPKETLNEDLARAGLVVAGEHDFLPEQYYVIYKKE